MCDVGNNALKVKRTEMVNCEDCRYFLDNKELMHLGNCHRYAPRAEAGNATWPIVDKKDCCGEGTRTVVFVG